MFIVQCVSSLLSLLQILKSVYHIKSIFENLNTAIIVWLIKHFWLKSSRNFCRQNSAKFSANSHDLKHSNYIYYTENHWQQPIYSTTTKFVVNPKHIFFDYQLFTCALIFRQLARALARADACGRWSPYSSFPSFVSLSPCPSFLSSPCQLSSLSLLINPPYPLPPLGSSIFASNNSSPPHPPPPSLSFSILSSSHTP